MKAGVGHRIAGLEVVGPVGDDVVGAHQVPRAWLRVSRRAWASTATCGLSRATRVGGALDLEAADVRRAVDHLPLQVRERHGVVVDDADRADPGRREVLDQRRTEPAGADHQHPGRLELRLPRPADVPQHEVAGIAVDLVG